MREVIEFRVWKKWAAEFGRCQAITARGRQCKNNCTGLGSVICCEGDFHAVEFVMGVTDRCRVHTRPVPQPSSNPAEIERLLALLEDEADG
ncbi:MAG: hypothetical protein U0871_24315 [Gemmataceae bacterium]